MTRLFSVDWIDTSRLCFPYRDTRGAREPWKETRKCAIRTLATREVNKVNKVTNKLWYDANQIHISTKKYIFNSLPPRPRPRPPLKRCAPSPIAGSSGGCWCAGSGSDDAAGSPGDAAARAAPLLSVDNSANTSTQTCTATRPRSAPSRTRRSPRALRISTKSPASPAV